MGIENYVMESGGKIQINWGAIVELEGRRKGIDSEEYDEILEFLKEKKILTRSAKNNFFILGCGTQLNPGYKEYYFTNSEDAKDYGKAKHKDVLYDIRIAQIVSENLNKR